MNRASFLVGLAPSGWEPGGVNGEEAASVIIASGTIKFKVVLELGESGEGLEVGSKTPNVEASHAGEDT